MLYEVITYGRTAGSPVTACSSIFLQVYSAADLRDPFVATAEGDNNETTKTSLLNPDSSRPKEPLEAFPLDSLSMVGIIEQNVV